MTKIHISKKEIKSFLRVHETKNLMPITDEVRLENLTNAFFRWANLPAEGMYLARTALWNEYCDYRDNLPPGTTAKKFSGSYENPAIRFLHPTTGVKH